MKRFKVTLTITDNNFPELDKYGITDWINSIQRQLNSWSILRIIGIEIVEEPPCTSTTTNKDS